MSSTRVSDLDWNPPTQARGHARVEAILSATRELIVEAGHIDLKMSDVAKAAEIPIGSLYQYFPTRTALLGQVFAREMAPIDQSLKSALETAQTVKDVLDGISGLVRAHVELVRKNPGLFVLWTAPGIDPALQSADLMNSIANAQVIADRLMAINGSTRNAHAIYDTALLICHVWGRVIRLNAMLEIADPDNTVIDQYVGMIEARLRDLLGKFDIA